MGVTIINGRLTMSAHIHTFSTRCVMWTVSQSLSEEAADLTAATVVSVASPTASFSAFSWYRMRDLHWLPVCQRLVFKLYKLLHGMPITLCIWQMTDNTLLAAVMDCDCHIGQHHYQACDITRTRTTFGDPSVRSSQSMGKNNVFPMVEKTELWTSAVYCWRRSCQAVVKNPTFMRVSVVCRSCMQTSFQPMPAKLTNRITAEYFCSVHELWRY